MTETIHTPWTDEQVAALNAFQRAGAMHPFTCGALHESGQSPVLAATSAGWVCPDPRCEYTQEWAHAFMAAPSAVAQSAPAETALRDRIAEAVIPLLLDTLPKVIAKARGYEIADVLLAAVLPAADRPAEEAYRLAVSTALRLGTGATWEAIRDRAEDLTAEVEQLTAAVDRAPVYRELADRQTQLAVADDLQRDRAMATARRQLVKELRRLAVEAQQPGIPRCPACGHVICNGDGPCGAIVSLSAVSDEGRCPCTSPGAPAVVPAGAGEEPADETRVVCEGFQWIGQPFTTCDRCARPAWEHVGEDVPVEGAGPFDNRRTVRPWGPGEADRIRAKWAPAAVSQPGKEA